MNHSADPQDRATLLSSPSNIPVHQDIYAISFRQVRAFLAVAERRSITVAAKELCLTQSGMSRVIRELECALGVNVFERKPQGLALTDAGSAFMPYAQRLAECYAATIAAGSSEAKSNRLTLAATNVVLSVVLPALLDRVQKTASGAHISFHELPSHQVQEQVATGKADAGLCMYAGERSDIESIPLLNSPLGLLAGRNVPLPAVINSLAILAVLPLARLSDDMVLPQALHAHGVAFGAYFDSAIVSNSMQALFSTVAQGRLATLVSAIAAFDAEQRQMKFLPLPDLLPALQLCLIGRADSGWQTTHAVWLDAIRSSVLAAPWPAEVTPL